MIESAIQSLSGNDRVTKLETYTTLSELFRAFDNIPDRAQLFPRLSQMFSLILADISRGLEDNPKKPDVPLNTKALKVAGFMLFDKQISSALQVKMARSLIEHSLHRMEAENVSKATSTQVLWLWQTQNLPRSVLSTDLAERMLLAAMKVDFPSLIINQERMAVLLRLLDQSRESMVKHAEVWLHSVISCMLDDNKQIRTAALRVALEAGKHLCKVPSIGRCVQNHLKSEVAGIPFIEVTTERFKSIIQDADGGIYVAHAWGAICTLSSSQNPEKSKTLMAWMHVLQIVFNSPATENKVMAQSAWVRMIHYFTNNADVVYREKNLSYLLKPMSRMLSREVRVYDTVRMAAVNSVCSLLYALLKPSLTHDQSTMVWKEVIEPVITIMLQDYQKGAIKQRAVQILISILEPKILEPWTLERLLDGKVGSENEIMHLDPKWVRSNASLVAGTIEVALQSDIAEDHKLRSWTALQRSLRTASAKEIQISAEAMEATAALCTVFRSLWTAQLPPPGSPTNKVLDESERRTAIVTELILCSFDQFGISYFTEKTLSFPEAAEIRPAQSPSKKATDLTPKGSGLKFLFKLYQNPVSASVVGDNYIDLLEKVTSRATSSQKSLRKCLDLLSQCLECVSAEKTKIPIQSWKVLAEIAQLRINAEINNIAMQSPNMCKSNEVDERWHATEALLRFGIRIQHGPAYQEWCRLAETLHNPWSKRDAPGVLSAILLENECLQYEYVRVIMKLAKNDHSRSISGVESLEKERQTTHTDIDLQNLFGLISRSLIKIESTWKKYKLSQDIVDFITEVAALINLASGSMAIVIVNSLSSAVAAMIGRSQEGTSVLVSSSISLMQRSSVIDSKSLREFSSLIEACLNASDEAVVAETINFWNSTFGKQARLEYPARLVEVIQKRNFSIGQLSLPAWPIQDPEVSEEAEISVAETKSRPSPPKMTKLMKSAEKEPENKRRQSKPTTSSRMASNVDVVSEQIDLVFETTNETSAGDQGPNKKRKRSTRKSAATSSQQASPSVSRKSSQTPGISVSPAGSTSRRKRQKRSQTNEHGSPSRTPVDTHSKLDEDVFGALDGGVFTLKKRELRATSPQIHSDPISESSPSVYSRIRKKSSSQERPTMEELRHSIRSLSPSEGMSLVVHEDKPGFEDSDRLMEEDEIASPIRLEKVAVVVNSDDLMQLQIQQEQSEDDQETIDEDLFILQLQQYRASLKQGQPITPRRREKLGTLMKEMTRLTGAVTDAYFDGAG